MAATETIIAEPHEAEEQQQQQQHHVYVEAEPLSYKTVVLRVSIHCQGCKRKVQKILQAVHGVHTIDIDLRQHKVVVTGNVNSETLIWKLTKAGKHAELWPQLKADSKKKKQPKPESSQGINQTDKQAVNVVAQGTNANVSKPGEGCATGKAGVQIQEPKPEVIRQTVVLPPAGPVTEKVSIAVQVPNDNEATGNENITGGTGGGGAGKKKKKKASVKGSTNNNANEGAGAATVTVEHAKANDGSGPSSGNQSHGQGHVHVHGPWLPFSSPANESPPRNHNIYRQYPPHYYAPPPPPPPTTPAVHTVMSYHTAHPSSSYGTAYYTSPQPYSYAHVVRPGNEMEPPPPYTYERESYASSQPSDSFELFSDENPNACSVM
ncbi:hypothetical protein JHK87_028155 [Glycine soja]|nr:hypothetical protein JHK87_028155 [Glycine soja]